MGTLIEITVPKEKKDVANIAQKKINEFSLIVSTDLALISGSFDTHPITELTYNLLKKEQGYQEQYPVFNSALFTISKLYGFPSGPFKMPENDEIAKTKKLFFANKLVLTENEGGYFANASGLSVDLGAFAKGVAVDLASEALHNEGIDRFIVNAGGDLYASGYKLPDKTEWSLGIKNPNKEKSFISKIQLYNKALATSGAYERFFVNDEGKVINHIFNAKSGESEAKYKSVSVIAESCEKADLLATVIFLSTLDEALDICAKQNTPMLIMDMDDKLHKLCGWENYEI